VVTFRIIWRKSLHAIWRTLHETRRGDGLARIVSDNAATPANHDARAALTCVESRASGRVHRLDRCSGFDTGQSTHSRSLAFDLSLRSRLAGIKALYGHWQSFRVSVIRPEPVNGLRRVSFRSSASVQPPDDMPWPSGRCVACVGYLAGNRLCGPNPP
jgi:hypothetical protein